MMLSNQEIRVYIRINQNNLRREFAKRYRELSMNKANKYAIYLRNRSCEKKMRNVHSPMQMVRRKGNLFG